jgi:isopenicillin N synthase-like dioxygenase
VDLRTAYLGLGELIFATGKSLLRAIGLDEQIGLRHDLLSGYGRLLHYHPEKNTTPAHQDWCGAHYDHGVFTGLIPAQYFLDGQPVAEPQDAGLYIIPTGRDQFEKVSVPDQSILLFQVGETGQLLSNDRIRATKHIVKKISQGMERYTFALFYSAEDDLVIRSTSHLTKDARFTDNQSVEGTVTAGQWQAASYARYRAK